MKNKILMKPCTKYMSVLLVLILLLSFTGCQKTYAFEELRQSYDELHTDWVNKEYRGVVDLGIEAIKKGNKVGFIIVVDMNKDNSYTKESTQKLKEKYGDTLKIKYDSLEKYAAEELKPYHEEICADWENGKYPGLMEMTGDVLTVDFNHEKAEQTAESLKLKYGDKIIVRICEIYISQL
jgi:hypothetical protein